MLTDVSVVPFTVCVDDVLLYVPMLVPYSNPAVVVNPLAFTVPFKVAELVVTFVAEPVVTFGGCAGVGDGVGVGVGVGVTIGAVM